MVGKILVIKPEKRKAKRAFVLYADFLQLVDVFFGGEWGGGVGLPIAGITDFEGQYLHPPPSVHGNYQIFKSAQII